MKVCKKCLQEKNFDNYKILRKNKNGTNLYKSQCNDCYNKHYIEKYRSKSEDQRKKIYQEKKDKTTFDIRKNWRLKHRFGINLDIFTEMYEKQNGRCYLCEKKIEGKDVKVDHNHQTGKLRKLLCHNCNTSLGLLGENLKIFYKCIDYLKEHDDKIQTDKVA
jgi:hypothetical protein